MGVRKRKKKAKMQIVEAEKAKKEAADPELAERAAAELLQAKENKRRKRFMDRIRQVCLEEGYDLNPIGSLQVQKIQPEALAEARKAMAGG